MVVHVGSGFDDEKGVAAFVVSGNDKAGIEKTVGQITQHFETSLTCKIDILRRDWEGKWFVTYVRVTELTEVPKLDF